MGDIVVFDNPEGEKEELSSDSEEIVNIHINEDKRAVVVKYTDRRKIIPLERVHHVIHENKIM